MSTPEVEIALRVFRRIKAEFPALSMTLDTEHPHVDVALEIPTQRGLAFDVHLDLQNKDELHLASGGFWCEWFPCTDARKEETYREAVTGLLAGSHRIVETLHGDRVVRAELQRPVGEAWETLGTYLAFSWPWQRKHTRIVQNQPSGSGTGSRGAGQWEAGTLALQTIARWMIDGGDPERLREFIRWLTPDDVVQTEHLFILDALKVMERAGGEMSRDRLNALLAEVDPACFARLVLDNLIEHRDDGARDDQEFAMLMSALQRLRATSQQVWRKAARRRVEIARKILARSIGVIEGARLLEEVELFSSSEPYVFGIFSTVTRAAREFPEGSKRKHWAPDALVRKDAERKQFEADAWPGIERACKELVNRWGS